VLGRTLKGTRKVEDAAMGTDQATGSHRLTDRGVGPPLGEHLIEGPGPRTQRSRETDNRLLTRTRLSHRDRIDGLRIPALGPSTDPPPQAMLPELMRRVAVPQQLWQQRLGGCYCSAMRAA